MVSFDRRAWIPVPGIPVPASIHVPFDAPPGAPGEAPAASVIPIELYPTLKFTHVSLVVASITLFAARGAAVLAGRLWAMVRPVRMASVAIDTLLLAAGAGLWMQLSLQPVRDAWLGVKLVLLVVYIVLGSLALKRLRTRRGRALAYASALACYGWMASVALLHDPLGALRLLLP
ncbi:MAG: SirB2 family protein [Burkholderiales bacterium]|nr:SirB2 family protein [Burkholderiales bacterium]